MTQEVNGKEVQIQITGFMEKNTGKFMKELWTLLLSAQKNASGVPQQFLDAKEEELLKKKVLLRLNMLFIFVSKCLFSLPLWVSEKEGFCCGCFRLKMIG